MNETGKRIAIQRKINGLSQEDLAEKVHVSRQTVSKWEVGAILPNNDNLKLLCEIFGTDADYFLCGAVNAEPLTEPAAATAEPDGQASYEEELPELPPEKPKRGVWWLLLAIALSVIAVFGVIFIIAAGIIFFQPRTGIEEVTVSVFHNPQGFAVMITAITVLTACAVTLVFWLISKKLSKCRQNAN